jgi:hypothetical protein
VKGVFTGDGGPLTTIVTSLSPAFFTSPSINDAGTVAFEVVDFPGFSGIFTGSGWPLTPIVDSTGPFFSFSSLGVAINDAGTVAFSALLWGGTFGIFTGPDPVADKVIQEGDPLFGSTVVSPPSFFREGLNNGGQIVFGAELANGTRGIFLATPVTLVAVTIDIKPGDFPNSINPRSKRKIPVAILSSPTFDAPAHVHQGSLTFGQTGDEPSLDFCTSGPDDVNGNGWPDLLCHFHTPTAAIQAGDTEGVLKGQTLAAIPFSGSDSVRIVPPR